MSIKGNKKKFVKNISIKQEFYYIIKNKNWLKRREIKLLDITASNSIVAVRLKNVISEKGLKQRLNPYGSLKLHRDKPRKGAIW